MPESSWNDIERCVLKGIGWDWPNTRGKIERHRDGNCGPVWMIESDPKVVI